MSSVYRVGFFHLSYHIRDSGMFWHASEACSFSLLDSVLLRCSLIVKTQPKRHFLLEISWVLCCLCSPGSPRGTSAHITLHCSPLYVAPAGLNSGKGRLCFSHSHTPSTEPRTQPLQVLRFSYEWLSVGARLPKQDIFSALRKHSPLMWFYGTHSHQPEKLAVMHTLYQEG